MTTEPLYVKPELATDIKVVNAADVADDDGAYPAVPAEGISAVTTYKDDDGNDVTVPTRLAVQGVDQYGVLRNTAEDQIITPAAYYSTKSDKAEIFADGTLMPVGVGGTVIRITPYKLTDVKVTIPQLKTAPEAGNPTASTKIIKLDKVVDTTKHYIMISETLGKSDEVVGVDGGATFTFDENTTNGDYYLFETDGVGNITSYATKVTLSSLS